MYEELVKRMRAVTDGSHEDKCDGCPYDEDYPCCVDCLDTMIKQAADAIEELQAQNNELLFRCGKAEALIDYYQTGKLRSNEPPKEEVEA